MPGSDRSESYTLFIDADVHAVRRKLPGNIRRQVHVLLNALPIDPRPPSSRPLRIDDVALPQAIEVRRVRIKTWRVLYAIHDAERWVWVIGVRRRPPYDYQDLPEIVERLGDE